MNLAAITAAICTGKESHEDPTKRYVAGVSGGVFYLVLGIFGATLVSIFTAFPSALIAALAGLALLAAIGGALSAAMDLVLPRPAAMSVEHAVREHLTSCAAPVYYVENALINSLLGLLCWDAIFAPLPGAFFHPFHAAPADLARPDFHARRAGLFDVCLNKLGTDEYRDCIRRVFREKAGLQSQFVSWGLLDETLLELALDCIPAEHLKAFFTRILQDVTNHRSGLPDLIQFWPDEQRYQLIEVKGPGDRLQDNQKRWIAFAQNHQMPIAVCYVQWAESSLDL